MLPIATHCPRGSRAGHHPGRGNDAHVDIQAVGEDVHASFLRGWSHHEKALAGQELIQCSSRTRANITPLIQHELNQGVEEPDPPLSSSASSDSTSELHGPQQRQPESRRRYSHPLQPSGAATSGLEVVTHVPPGMQVGNLRQLPEAVIQWSTRLHQVRYSRHDVGEQEQLR